MRWLLLLILLLAMLLGLGWLFASARPVDADFRFITAVEINTLDPQRMSWMHDIRIAECLFEGLLRVQTPSLAVAPATAERFERSPDGLTYTFHLRPAARWSNGEEVTAQDFIYAWRRAILPDHAADYTNLFFCIQGAEEFFDWRDKQLADYVQRPASRRTDAAALALWREADERFRTTVGLSAPDPRTLVVRLARPTPYFLELVAFATFVPVHEKSVEAVVNLDADTGRRIQDARWTQPGRLVCNGPYTLKRWRFKRDLLLVANDHYWNRAAMGNTSILQLQIEDPMLALLTYENGQVDWLPDLPTASTMSADLVAQHRPDLFNVPAAGTYYYIFNCADKLTDGKANPLADARVRRALSMGIDRQAIVTKVTRMNQPVARTLVPVGAQPGYDPPVEAGVTFDPAGARQLLAEAGYATPGTPGTAGAPGTPATPPKPGKPLAGLSIIYNTEGGHDVMAQQIARSWQENLGVVVTLQGVETRMFSERRKTHDFTIARAGWYGDYRDPTTFLDLLLTANTGNNDGQWSNREFDALMQRAATELDVPKRTALLRQAEALMLHEQPIAPIYQYTTLQLFDPKKVQGLDLNAWSFRRLEGVKVVRQTE